MSVAPDSSEADAIGVRPALVHPDEPLLVTRLLEAAAEDDPHGLALVSRHARLDFSGLAVESSRAATVLAGLGVGPGDVVAASMGNHCDLVVAFLATMRLGAIWVGVNTSLASSEVAFLLEDAGASLFVTEVPERAPASRCGALRHVVTAVPGSGGDWQEQISAASPSDPVGDADPHGPAALAYTSGTTGRPKGVVHSQHNLLLPGTVAALTRPDPTARPGVCLPLTILNLLILGPLSTLQQRQPCILMDRIDATGIAGWVREERVSTFAAVPTILHDLLTNPDVGADDLSSLVRPAVGGAACPEVLRSLYEERFGFRVTTAYGLTEAPTAVTAEDPLLPAVPGASGRALPHLRITIRDDAGVEVPTGETGEICVGPTTDGPFAGLYRPMLGYWRRPEAAAEAFVDGGSTLRTGDVGHLSAEGELFVTDRKNDLIIRGGANVYPAEVERLLEEIPGVTACAVVGLPDGRLGERVAAAVVVNGDDPPDAESVADACRRSLARYKVPEEFLFVDDLPRNAMGKVVKRSVVDLFAPPPP